MRSKRTLAMALTIGCVLGVARAADAGDQVIFVVRHAERADAAGAPPPAGMMANDPPLSAAGNERARRLAMLLASPEVKHIFTTEFQRTRQTAAPLSEATRITPVTASARDASALAQQVRSAAGNVLIVGHSNTVPDLLKQLGVTTPVAIGENEYDNVFVVVRPATGPPTLIRLRY
jgi:broad specificity phosphatase PhoE